MATFLIEKFEDLHKILTTHSDAHFIYRGEDDAKYELRTKFGRYLPSQQQDAVSHEIEMLEAFKRRSSSHVSLTPSNDWEWLAVAQHSGLATRLLDWTENLLVAAYFATSSRLEIDNDRVIYAMNVDALNLYDEKVSPFELKTASIYRPKQITNRIITQSGLFTAHPNPSEKFENAKLERFVISRNAVIEIAVYLDSYGFNRATMFPGLRRVSFSFKRLVAARRAKDIPL